MQPIILTKSDFLIGLECPKYLWMIYHEPEKKRKMTLVEKFKLMEGQTVGKCAKHLFRDGIDIVVEEPSKCLQKTKDLLSEGKVLFEAGFQANNCFSRVDILVPVGEKWDLIEVKSSQRVKDVNIFDVAFQKYLLETNGLEIRKCFLMHLNNNYVRKGALEVEQLFVKEDITVRVASLREETKKRIADMFAILSLKEPPSPGILLPKVINDGVHNCCEYGCLALPDNHVFSLYRGKELASKLFKNGIKLLKDIPDNYNLTAKQKIQKECAIEGKVHINKEKLNNFIDMLQYPLYYLDFETFAEAIPKFDGLKPHSKVPFQFSLHVVKAEDEEAVHFEYLHDDTSDPRKQFLLELQRVLGDKGSIIVYNKAFESGILKELGEFSPEHKEWINTILGRFVDLLVPFREFSYYNTQQKGRVSLKAVYYAVTGKSYENLKIQNGLTASIEFLRMISRDCEKQEKQRIKENLLKYCELDTMAQLEIVKALKYLVS